MSLGRCLRNVAQNAYKRSHFTSLNAAKVRKQSTFHVSSTSNGRLLAALATASIVGGIGGYLAADYISSSPENPSKTSYARSKYGGPQEVAAAIRELRELFPPGDDGRQRVSDDKKTLEVYGYSHNSYHPESLHSVIVKVMSTEEVVKVVNVARKYKIPIAPYSGGTSLEGHFSGVSMLRFAF